MNFTISKAPFAAALARCAAIAPTFSTMPILSCVLLKITEAGVHLAATDLEVGYETFVEWTDAERILLVNGALSISVPAKKLHECAKAIPTPAIIVAIDLVAHAVTIAGGTVSFTLGCMDDIEFPAMPTITADASQFVLDAPALVKILEAVAYAQSTDEKRYNINGCLLRVETNTEDEQFLTACATDGHRLAVDSVPLPGDPRPIPKDLAKGVIIPTKGVAEICKIRTTGVIVLSIAGNNLAIATDSEKLYLRMIDGDYPDFTRVIPDNLDKKIEIKRQALIDALERCRILTEKKSRGVDLVADNGTVSLSSDLAAINGHAEDRITAVVPLEKLSMRINVEYLLQSLENMSGAEVEIAYRDQLSPVRINPIGTDEPLAIIMPMRGA